LGVRGPKSKIEEQHFVEGVHGEMMAQKWLDSIEKQKRRSNLKECDRQGQRDRQTDRVNC